MTAILVEKLGKNYGSHRAVDGISFAVEEGEVVGFLGPNGAGKSTTLKIITGFLSPTDGHTCVEGVNVLEHPTLAQQKIGYLPENAPIYSDMRVGEYLEYVGKIRGLGKIERARAIGKVAERCGIEKRLKQEVDHLSKGFRQRVGLAQAMLHDPGILILDEPTVGLDPRQIGEVRSLIGELAGQYTVILSTHILQEVTATCQRVVIINQGNIVADDPLDTLVQKHMSGNQPPSLEQVFLSLTEV